MSVHTVFQVVYVYYGAYFDYIHTITVPSGLRDRVPRDAGCTLGTKPLLCSEFLKSRHTLTCVKSRCDRVIITVSQSGCFTCKFSPSHRTAFVRQERLPQPASGSSSQEVPVVPRCESPAVHSTVRLGPRGAVRAPLHRVAAPVAAERPSATAAQIRRSSSRLARTP